MQVKGSSALGQAADRAGLLCMLLVALRGQGPDTKDRRSVEQSLSCEPGTHTLRDSHDIPDPLINWGRRLSLHLFVSAGHEPGHACTPVRDRWQRQQDSACD